MSEEIHYRRIEPTDPITDWSIGGPADRPFESPEAARKYMLGLLGVEPITDQPAPTETPPDSPDRVE